MLTFKNAWLLAGKKLKTLICYVLKVNSHKCEYQSVKCGNNVLKT